MFQKLLFLLLLSSLASCSMSSSEDNSRAVASTSNVEDNTTLVLDDDDEVIVLDEELQQEIVALESNDVIVEEDNIFHDEDEFKEINRSIASTSKELYEINYDTYEVVKGDTLMLIAFKIYGDVSKWRHLSVLNEEQLFNDNIEVGMKLRYEAPEDEFVWKPMGKPYMVKEDDSLSIISGTVYDSTKHWKYIWDNNRPLVKNPNLIFAGFTLYYLPIEEKNKYQEVLNARYKRMKKALEVELSTEKNPEKLASLDSLSNVL